MKNKKIVNSKVAEGRVFLVNTLGIIFDPEKRMILIGKRVNDPFIKKLSWCFPGGKVEYGFDLEGGFEKIVKEKTGLIIKSLGPVFAKIPEESEEILLAYLLCEVIKGNEKPAKDLVELRWVRPQDLEKHFTTSFDPRLKEYIMNLR